MTSRFRTPPTRRGFSLVELLTVVGIIALLISILLPSLRSARLTAKRTATAAIIKSMADGLEMFYNDFNRYPDSKLRSDPLDLSGAPLNLPDDQLSGAHWLYRSLMGFDGLGVDGKGQMLGDGALGKIAPADLSARKGAYIDELKFAKDNDPSAFNVMGSPSTGRPVAYDVFKGPILYYRANPKAQQPFDNSVNRLGVYNSVDNAEITTNWNFGGAGSGPQPVHPLGHFGDPSTPDMEPVANGVTMDDAKTFIGYLHDHQVETTANVLMPVKKDSYVIISAGPDGFLGTDDDVKNFD